MARKNTIAALRIKHEMVERSLSGSSLAALAHLPYHAVENILSGKSSKIEKLEVIARALGKPLMYFIDADYDVRGESNNNADYDGELHYKVIKIISDICKKNKIYLTKDKMDKLFDLIYPRLKKDDPDKLIFAQTEAIINYALKNHL